MSEGKMDSQVGATSAEIQVLYQKVVAGESNIWTTLFILFLELD